MCEFCLSELLILQEELKCSIEAILSRGFIGANHCVCHEYEKMRYRRLVRLYQKIGVSVLDILDELDSDD